MKFLRHFFLAIALGLSNDLAASETDIDIQLDDGAIVKCMVTESQNHIEYRSLGPGNKGDPDYYQLGFRVLPKEKLIFLDGLYSNAQVRGTPLVNFLMNIAVKYNVDKISFSSEFGSWGFYYKLGFRPRMLDLQGEIGHGYGKFFIIDFRKSLAMAIDLGCASKAVLIKKDEMMKNLAKAKVYFAENYLQEFGANKHVERELKRVYWNKKAPNRVQARTIGYGDAYMVMNSDSIQRFEEIQALNPRNHKAIRLLGDEILQQEEHEEFLSATIPDPKELIDHLANIYGILSVKK